MKRFIFQRGAFLVAAACLAAPSAASADGPEIRITGGGVADFLDPNPCRNFNTDPPFGESVFSVSVRVDEDDIDGIFLCGVEDCFLAPGEFADILIIGWFTDVLGASDAGQDTVTLVGDAVLFIEGISGVQDEFEFMVELREGGPGRGGFTYTDYVTQFGAGIEYGDGLVDDGSDHELITRGRIRVHFDD